ncbi:uncharacterized protein BKCO1_1300083 [Diplodia corticola]|uniref:Uncharacterized protein n=1 Tax=Diplodia corticola TaxID=236234 RepID=A0A1J9S8Y4_9PEZI|nr:uncharacterized protein BKCO1_1300083 [Diplodia corticola]OJD36045.1 hypothetical protein BKCO1_1300083 [Diplodia corticola]
MSPTTADTVNQWAEVQRVAYERACPQPDLTFEELMKILKNVLAGITSTAEGAKRIESLVMNRPEDFFNKYASTVYQIIHAGAAFDDDVILQRLAALTAALAALPDAKNTTGKTLTWADEELGIEGKSGPGKAIVHDRQRLWSDLPTFGDEMRRMWIDGPASKAQREEEGLSEEAARQQWSNCNAFAAHLAKLSQRRGDVLDLYLCAIWTLRRALEDRKSDGCGQPHELRMHIAGAAQWIRILGKELRDADWKFSGSQKLNAGGGPRYDADLHGYGFSEKRWELWKCRFEDFAQDETVDEETRQIARDAAREMA